jgi:hypothetical protein
LLLEALTKGFQATATRSTRLVEVGESAGKTITCPGHPAEHRPEADGQWIRRLPLDRVLGAIPTLFSLAAAGALTIGVESVPPAEVESAWTRVEKGRRIVFTET